MYMDCLQMNMLENAFTVWGLCSVAHDYGVIWQICYTAFCSNESRANRLGAFRRFFLSHIVWIYLL